MQKKEPQGRTPKRGKVSKADEALIALRRAKALYWKTRGRTLETIMEMSQREDWDPWPYRSIASVHQDITEALKEAKLLRNQQASEFIEMENGKLDRMEEAAWIVLESLHYVVNQGEVVYLYDGGNPDSIKQGWARSRLDPEVQAALERKKDALGRTPLEDNKPVLDAITVLLKIAERRAKLNGFDAPVKKQVDVISTGGIDDRIAGLMAKLAGGGQGEIGTGASAGVEPPDLSDSGRISTDH